MEIPVKRLEPDAFFKSKTAHFKVKPSKETIESERPIRKEMCDMISEIYFFTKIELIIPSWREYGESALYFSTYTPDKTIATISEYILPGWEIEEVRYIELHPDNQIDTGYGE